MEGIRLETQIKEISGYNILYLAGEIDVYTAPALKAAINKLLDTGIAHLVIDMSDVGYMDSSGFGALLSAVKRLAPNGGTVNLVNCSSGIERILGITKLDTIFICRKTMKETLEALGIK